MAVRGRAEEGGVHNVLHAGLGGRVDERVVLLQPVLGFGRGDHEQGLDALQGRPRQDRVRIAEDQRHRALQLRCAAGVAHQQPLRVAGVGQLPGHQPAQDTRWIR